MAGLVISFDLSNKIQEFSLSPVEARTLSVYVLDRVVEEYMSKWQALVNTNLHSSRDEYKRAMYADRPNDKTAVIGLTSRDSKLAMMIEMGASAFDEKAGFEKSSLKTEKKDGGWYLTIPFRHAVGDEIMNVFAAGSKTTLLDLMKQGNTVTAADLPEGHNEAQVHSIMGTPSNPLIEYTHKSPIFEGMKRYDISSTQKEKRGGYMTFRRVSDKSDPDSWFHPGFANKDLMGKALQEAQFAETFNSAVEEFINAKIS